MSENTKLAAEIRAGNYEDRAWMMSALDRAADALEAAEAELTRRDTVIARITEWRAGAEGRKLLGDPAAMDWPIDLYLAAAPVSLEAVKAETTDRRPHSRACGFRKHEHGTDCNPNCQTCHGRSEAPHV